MNETAEQVAAEVLAEHQFSAQAYYQRTDQWTARCSALDCDWKARGDMGGWDAAEAAHRAHLASVLAARLDDGLGMVCDAYGLPHDAVALARHLANNYGETINVQKAHIDLLTTRLDGLAAKVRELADEWEDCGDEDCTDGCWFVRRLRKLLLDQPHTGTNP